MKKTIRNTALLLLTTSFVACQNNVSLQSNLIETQDISTFGKNKVKDFFSKKSIANYKTQKFLTDSPASDEHPIWSPNGKQIAFQRGLNGSGYNIWLMNSDGTNQRKLTNCKFDCQQATWSPDGKYIAYRKASRNYTPENPSKEYDIAMIDTNSGQEKMVVVYPGDDKHPTFSRDGKYIVFNSERDKQKTNIYYVPTNNTRSKPKQITKNNLTNDVHPSFSRDGRKVLFHSYLLDAPKINEESQSRLGIINTNGSGFKWLNIGKNLIFPKHPFFTPNSNIVTFHATDKKDLKRNIYYTNLNKTGKAISITDIKNAKHPQVSPNGKFLAYSHKRKLTNNSENQYDISIVEINLNKAK